MLYIA